MESTSPEHPVPRPIDRTSLSDAQKKSFQETVDQAREEEVARRQSMPTKLLGWMLIATLGFDIAAGFSGADANLGCIIFFFSGIAVLRGSQAALRTSTFLLILLAAVGWTQIALTFASVRPLEIGGSWFGYGQLKFWSLGICPNVYFTTAAILAFSAFRKREISFWSPTVKKSGCVVAVIFLVGGVQDAFDLSQNRALEKSFCREIQAARLLVKHPSRPPGTASITDWIRTFDPMESVMKVSWMTSPGGSIRVYDRESRIGRSRSTYRLEHYSEWLRLPSGEWGKLELELILPEAP